MSFETELTYASENSALFKEDSVKLEALKILESKCNVCHLKKRREVYTEENMDDHASLIHTQVFVKERMPKGKLFNLTNPEKEMLLTWIRLVLDEERN